MRRTMSTSCALVSAGAALVLGAGPAVAASSGSGGNSAFFNSCSEARAAGQANIPETQASYREELDQDRDGVACETNEGSGSSSGATNGSLSTGGSGSVSGGGSGTIRINTGTGGQAGRADAATPAAVPLAVGGAGVLVLAGSVLALRRRTGATPRG